MSAGTLNGRRYRFGGEPVTTTTQDFTPETKTEIEEAMRNVVATLARMPAHWQDRRAGMHLKLNDLLTLWEMAP